MDDNFVRKLDELRREFVELAGHPFEHFFCPVLFRDDDVPLSRAHIVNLAFPNSTRLWTIQRTDVDNFFGSIVESDFVDLQHRDTGIAAKSLVDPHLRRRFKPRILLEGTPIEYFNPTTGPIPEQFTGIQLELEGQKMRLGLKISPAQMESHTSANWQIEVAKDARIQSVVAVIKAAYLTLFEMCGYSYALSPAGAIVGHLLGSFFLRNIERKKIEILRDAVLHFRPVVGMVRPIESEMPSFRGTVEDGYAHICWLEGEQPERPWAIIVYVRTGPQLHAALMPFFDDDTGEARFEHALEGGGDTFVTSAVQFCGDHWKHYPGQLNQFWPDANFDA